MGQNPLNLALRFILELCILFAIAYWGWTRDTGVLRYVLAIGLLLIAAVLWGTFRVPGEVAGNPHAPVPVPGWLRLLLEIVLFGFAVWGLYNAGATFAAITLGAVALFHYAISYDRIAWLLHAPAHQ